MGPVFIFNIAFTSVSFFICFIALYISYKRKGDLLFPAVALLSAVSVIYFGLLSFCSLALGMDCPAEFLMRFYLVCTTAYSLTLLGVLYHQLGIDNKTYIFANSIIFWAFLLVAIILPEKFLFGEGVNVRTVTFSFGDSFHFPAEGWTLWRIMVDAVVITFAVSCILLLLKKLESISFRILVIIFACIGIILMAALWDQMVDLGQIRQVYLLSFAFFTFYMVMIILPMIDHLKELYDKQSVIDFGLKWQNFIHDAEFIVVVLNRMGHIEFANQYFYMLTGYSEQEVVGKDWFEFFIPPDEHYNVQGAFVEVLSYEFHPHYSNPILTRHKEVRMISWHNMRTRNKSGNITGSISLGIDITDEVREKEAVRRKLKEAERLIHKLNEKIDKS
jgi:PAS domain S-box-containing protein